MSKDLKKARKNQDKKGSESWRYRHALTPHVTVEHVLDNPKN